MINVSAFIFFLYACLNSVCVYLSAFSSTRTTCWTPSSTSRRTCSCISHLEGSCSHVLAGLSTLRWPEALRLTTHSIVVCLTRAHQPSHLMAVGNIVYLILFEYIEYLMMSGNIDYLQGWHQGFGRCPTFSLHVLKDLHHMMIHSSFVLDYLHAAVVA